MTVSVIARLGAIAALALWAAGAHAAPDPTLPMPGGASAAASPPPAGAPKPDGQFQPVAFTRLVLRLPVGMVAEQQQGGMFCNPTRTVTWPGGQTDWNIAPFKDPFRTEFLAAGLKVEGDPDNLFEATTSTADFAVAGIVNDLAEHYCTPNLTKPEQKGSVSMSVQWELYSRLQKQIVGTFTTSGVSDLPDPTPGGLAIMLSKAFGENVRQLAANNDFRKLIGGAARADGDVVKAPALEKISLVGSSAAGPREVDATVSSVVLIRAGADEGSGVLVSSDGYILTAAHVVGDASTVKVRWSDGVETAALVARVSKGRDVALLKTDARGRKPLALRSDEPVIGDAVFAVGSTMGDKFQSSVTKGVMSADRVIDGYSYIQSDVTVGPGASGGPLLDANGRVVGLVVGTITGPMMASVPTGIHLFVPTRDALSFLGLTN